LYLVTGYMIVAGCLEINWGFKRHFLLLDS